MAAADWRQAAADGTLAAATELGSRGLTALLTKSLERTEVVVTVDGQDRFFHQTRGLSMGKSFSPPLADLYMRDWEADLDQTAARVGARIAFACRYVDDYLLGWHGTKEQAEEFLAVRNQKHPDINVTME